MSETSCKGEPLDQFIEAWMRERPDLWREKFPVNSFWYNRCADDTQQVQHHNSDGLTMRQVGDLSWVTYDIPSLLGGRFMALDPQEHVESIKRGLERLARVEIVDEEAERFLKEHYPIGSSWFHGGSDTSYIILGYTRIPHIPEWLKFAPYLHMTPVASVGEIWGTVDLGTLSGCMGDKEWAKHRKMIEAHRKERRQRYMELNRMKPEPTTAASIRETPAPSNISWWRRLSGLHTRKD